ncbi:hypothetical protein [Hoeflea alexandrii]|uniref:Uncharacterized protein n=1 Tax=Hoeflea alexandrii TaxID=288436 RepID=A0ABT1CV47_9HYPH|nr:hypothetical protein [Hoeflea alexandrii]MCO6410072.1 hypothetical protein [Hoeflea alexandrii]MCY0153044.1 hypothetical protein [Hoeflea alexandrii]
MNTLREQFIRTFDAFVDATGVGEGTLSDRLLNGGGRMKRIRAGSDIATGTFERVMRWLSDNWPDGAEWPEGVDRPKTAEDRAAEAAPAIPEAAE